MTESSTGIASTAATFQIVDHTPADGATNVPSDVVIQLSFDQPPSARSLASASISDGLRQIPFAVATNGTTATLTPNEQLAGDTFTITLNALVTGADGSALTPLSFSFRTVQTPRRIFVSSKAGDADLSGWPDAGGKIGVDAADNVCQTLAHAAGLLGTFRAWLSTTTDDAYCRITAARGKKRNNCDAAALPTAAGPWSNTVGLPFSDDIAQLTAGGTLYAAYDDETGTMVSSGNVFTGTTAAGDLQPDNQTCSDWTAPTGTISHIGNAYGGISWWSDFAEQPCSAQGHLWCMQTGTFSAPPPLTAAGKTVFVHSLRVGGGNAAKWPGANGNSGLRAADLVCQNAAASAGLANPSAFKAWLSTSTINARDHITSDGPWVRIDHVIVATNRAQLLSGTLQAPIEVDENGNFSTAQVFTGTDASGASSAQTCNDWSSVSGSVQAEIGVPMLASAGWTDDFAPDCDESYAVYCFED